MVPASGARIWVAGGAAGWNETEANFYLVYTERATELCRWFLERKVIVRDCTGWPGLAGPAVRLAIRTRPENCRVVGMLKEFLCQA